MAFCHKNGISYSAYSPLGGLTGTDIFKDPTVISIGKVHKKSAAQVALRWLVQQKISIVTAADTAEYCSEGEASCRSCALWGLPLLLLLPLLRAVAFAATAADSSPPDMDLFDFELTAAEMAILAAIK